MTKALIKKQLLELFAFLFRDGKTGKRRTKSSLLLFAALYIFVFGYLAVAVFFLAKMIAEPFVLMDLAWLYMSIMSMMALVAGVIGGIFSSYTTLYAAKDNDTLLSYPIPPIRILSTKLFGIYLSILFYLLLVMVPATVVLFLKATVTPLSVIFSITLPFFLALFALVLSAILGFALALISAKIKRFRRPLTILLALGFIALYYYGYSKLSDILNAILLNATAVGDKIKSIFYPFYAYGSAATGDALRFLIFALIALALFGITLWILSHTFLGIATKNSGEIKRKYKAEARKAGSLRKALIKKEFRRFSGSTAYMLNTGLGILFMPAAGIALLFFQDDVASILNALSGGSVGASAVTCAALLCILASMNNMAAPSVSLEGKHLWLLRSYPIPAKEVFLAKLSLQLILTLPVLLIPLTTLLITVKMDLLSLLLVCVTAVLFVFFHAVYCLALSIKFPSFSWINETVPIKQSAPATLSLFGGWAIGGGMIGLYTLVGDVLNGYLYLSLFAGLLLALTALLGLWIFKKGRLLFESYN